MKHTQVHFLQRGFTLTELMLVVGILTTILGYMTINLIRSQSSASLSATIQVLVADMKEQQMKAMSGDTEGRSTNTAYGIHFDSAQYVLFNGTTYVPGSPSNKVVPLEASMVFENNLIPGGTLVFSKISGEVSGFTPGANTLRIRHIGSQQQKTVEVNKYGVIPTIN